MFLLRVFIVFTVFFFTFMPIEKVEAAPENVATPVDVNAVLRTFNTAWDDDDWDTANTSGSQLISLPIFDQQSDEFQYSILARLGFTRRMVGDFDGALEAWNQADGVSSDPSLLQYWRVYLFNQTENWQAATENLILLADTNKDLLNSIRIQLVFQILNGLRDADLVDREIGLMYSLLENYVPEEPFTTLEFIRLRQARRLVQLDDLAGALYQIQRLTRGDTRASIRTESAFAELWENSSFDILTNVQSGVEAQLALAQRQTEENPEYLEPISNHIRALLTLDRAEEAEAIGRATYLRLTNGEAFLDADENSSWLMNEYAYSLYALDRLEEANSVMRRAAGFVEGQNPNVSQTINLASMLTYQERYQDALEVLQVMDERPASPYGDMWVWATRACSFHMLGNRMQSEANIALLSENWEDNPSAYQKATICTERHDDAAELMIQRLQDPTHAPGALEAMQIRNPLMVSSRMPNVRIWSERVDQLANHPDVAEALLSVGRIEEVDIIDHYWGNF